MRSKYFKFKLLKKIVKRIKKVGIIKKFIILNFILSISGIYNLALIQPVQADSFYPSGDANECNFAQATSVSYRGLPNNCTGANYVSYNSSQVYGESGSYPENHNFHDVADVTYPDAHRYRGVADRVGVPPNTRIDVGYYIHNYSGHTITADHAYLFVSRSNTANGDWGRLGSGGTVSGIDYLYMGNWQTRDGRHVNLGNLGTYPANPLSNPPNGRTIYPFTTIQPIQIQSRTATPEFVGGGNLRIRYDLTVRNVSSYNLPNIRVIDDLPSGETFDQTVTFNSGQTRTFTYYANMGSSYSTNITNSPARISDPNRHKEEGAIAGSSIYDHNPETRTIIVNRTDSGAPSGWTARQPDFVSYPQGDYYFIELIPYTVYSGNTTVNVPPNISIEKVVSDNDETRVESNDSRPAEEITYDITVRNTGGNATGVVVVDDYDEDMLDILDADGGSDNGNTITWNIGNLQNQQTETFTIRARVTAPLAHGTYQAPNTVTVDSDQTNPIDDSTQTNITAEVRMEIDKTVSDSDETNTNSNHLQGGHPDNAERLSTYSINIENSGDADAHLVTIHDNVSEVIRNGSIRNISDNGVLTTRIVNGQLVGEIVWDIGDLPQGENHTVTFDVQFNAGIDDNTQINNIAEVRTQEVPPISDSTITTIHAPILEITKDDGLESAEPSQTVHWVINVRNVGTGNAYNTEVYDLVPERMSISNISDDGAWDEQLRRVVWSTTEPQYILNGSYDPDPRSIWGESKTLSFDATLDPIFPVGTTNLENVAITETSFYPPDQTEHNLPVNAYPENDIEKYVINETALENGRSNSGNEVDHDEYGADADEVFGTDSDVFAIAGDTLKYTLVYRNTGNAHSPDTYIEDHLPKFITDENGNQYQIILLKDIFDISDDIEVIETAIGFDIRWNVGELQVGQEWKVKEFRVQINPSSDITLSPDDAQRLIDNITEIASENKLVEIDTDNAIIRVNQPNAEITKDSDKLEYQSDEEVTYSIHVENIGSSRATGIVSDTLPEGLEFVASDFSEDQTIIEGQNISFNVSLGAGESIDIQITVRFLIPVTDLTTFNNEVDYEYIDLNENERPIVSDEVEVIVHAPILELEKAQELPEVVAPGQSIVYTINYRNTGTGYSPETVITDLIPEHTSFIEFIETESSIEGAFDNETDQVSWNIGQLNSEEEGSVSFRVVIDIPTESGTEIRNSAVIFTPVIEEVESEVVTAVASSCCMGGFIWEDSNNNGEFDESEEGIPDVKINIKWEESEYLGENSVDIYTEFNGHYEYTGLPYHTLLTIKVFKPEGFDNITTPDEFKLVLLPPNESGEIEDYEIEGVRYLTASGCINFLNAGIYRDVILAQTGQSILPPLVIGIGLISLGIGISILLLKRKKKQK